MGVGGGGGKAGVAHLQGLGAANWDGRPCPGGGGGQGAQVGTLQSGSNGGGGAGRGLRKPGQVQGPSVT